MNIKMRMDSMFALGVFCERFGIWSKTIDWFCDFIQECPYDIEVAACNRQIVFVFEEAYRFLNLYFYMRETDGMWTMDVETQNKDNMLCPVVKQHDIQIEFYPDGFRNEVVMDVVEKFYKGHNNGC